MVFRCGSFVVVMLLLPSIDSFGGGIVRVFSYLGWSVLTVSKFIYVICTKISAFQCIKFLNSPSSAVNGLCSGDLLVALVI